MNLNYIARIKEEIDKLLKARFIRPVKQATWLSRIVVVPKKNDKIHVCVDYRKLNTVTITYVFPLLFTDNVLDAVVGHDTYSFLDGFNRYDQVCMHPDDQEKTTFVMDLGVYVAVVMKFGLKTVPAMIQRTTTKSLWEYIPTFMQVFLDDFSVYGTRAEHLCHLGLCLERCCTSCLSLNPAKCAFDVTSGALLGHIISKEGIAVDPKKITAIIEAKTPTTAKLLNHFLGQVRYRVFRLGLFA